MESLRSLHDFAQLFGVAAVGKVEGKLTMDCGHGVFGVPMEGDSVTPRVRLRSDFRSGIRCCLVPGQARSSKKTVVGASYAR
jgi:hypothetical protein